MKIINMLDDYAKMCSDAKKIGKFEAYEQYTKKHPKLFDGVFKYLYMTDISNLRQMIEQCDFDSFLAVGEKNIKNGVIKLIENIAAKTAELLNYNDDFNVYIGLEMGKIGGTASVGEPEFLTEQATPFVYFGVDREVGEKELSYLIPHELNHMIRGKNLGVDLFDFTERVISEGLGTYCPVVLHGNDNKTDAEIIAGAMFIPLEKAKNLLRNRDELEKAVTAEFGTPMTAEKMSEFFTCQDPGEEYPLKGYFIGMCIISDLVKKGHALSELTVMPVQNILQSYSVLQKP